ncbi:hypothetical protein ABH942_002449 [Flavobacterium sp. 28YEA47A]|uniref:hypothetical protein n=1 Tax=Flavobacterium sp. 28YEA47A TaxID=3156276 RepID=UPI003512E018
MELMKLDCEDNNSSRRMQGKRTLANYETSKMELEKEIILLFKTYKSALYSTQQQMLSFKIEFRSRALEASIMQSFFAEYLKENFGNKAFYGKYKRLILRSNGYLILFKKFNNKGMPMNIKTINVQSILNQNQVLDLFASSDYNDEPILYFGYKKNRYGEYVNPQLIYVDEGNIVFSIGLDDMDSGLSITKVNDAPVGVSPTIRENNIKKAN